MDGSPDPDGARPALDNEYEQVRVQLDAQALAWAATVRLRLWGCGLAVAVLTAGYAVIRLI